MILALNILPILDSACFKSRSLDKIRIFLELKSLQCTQHDEVVDFSDAIRIALCVLNIESKQPVAILTFEWTL